MANELQTHYSSGATLYALLFDVSGQVWNGSAFVPIQAAGWAGYALPMTETPGTGIYYGSMPAVTAGDYSVLVYARLGASPASTDRSVAQGVIGWDGTAVKVAPTPGEIAAAVLDEPVDAHVNAGTTGHALRLARAQAAGKWTVNGNLLTVYDTDGETVLVTFVLDTTGEQFSARTPQ